MSMPTTAQPLLLAAKFHRPAAPRHPVARPALVARLNVGLAANHPLTLIAAPAGYGKTTLAAQWAAQLDRPAAWLALDEADDDAGELQSDDLCRLSSEQWVRRWGQYVSARGSWFDIAAGPVSISSSG